MEYEIYNGVVGGGLGGPGADTIWGTVRHSCSAGATRVPLVPARATVSKLLVYASF